eukprot:GHVS01012498.1.p1 GENE.GHVS01012498.1~~GHVS01012498.1.p1  ORF type:complete len:892 (+),score=158.17 GHVS01012498.1:332-2677(+)
MELMRGIKSHLAAAVAVVQAYAIILPHVRLHMTDRTRVKDKEKHVVLLSSPGHATSLRSSCACVLGERTTRDMLDFRLDDSNSAWSVEGLISKAQYGRKARDMQFYFINGRPVDAPKRIVKCVNDVFKQYSAKLYAVCVVHIRVAQSDVDVNVTPDKRSVFCVAEDELSESLSRHLVELLCPSSLSSLSMGGQAHNTPAATTAALPPPSSKYSGAKTSGEDAGRVVAYTPPPPEQPRYNRMGNSEHNYHRSAADRATLDKAADYCGEQEKERPAGTGESSQKDYKARGDDAASECPLALMDTTTDELLDVMDSSSTQVEVVRALLPGGRLSSSNGSRERESGFNGTVVDERTVVCYPQCHNEPRCEGLMVIGPHSSGGDHVCCGGVGGAAAAILDSSAEVERLHTDEMLLPIKNEEMTNSASEEEEKQQRPTASPTTEAAGALCLYGADRNVVQINLVAHFDWHKVKTRMGGYRRGRRGMKRKRDGGGVESEVEEPVRGTSEMEVAKVEDTLKAGAETVLHSLSDACESGEVRVDKQMFRSMQICGQFNKGFIITKILHEQQHRCKWSLFIVDQHASDEKSRFEKFNDSSHVRLQPLICPLQLELTPAQEQLAEAHSSVLTANGFRVDINEQHDQRRRFALTRMPCVHGLQLNQNDFVDLLAVLEEMASGAPSTGGGRRVLWEECGAIARPPRVWEMLASKACRSAVMIGDALSEQKMAAIVWRLSELQQPWNCPHGRPTMRHLYTRHHHNTTARPPWPAIQWTKHSCPLSDYVHQAKLMV